MTTITTNESIFVKGVCVNIDLGWWKGWTKLEAEDLDKDIEDIPKIYQLGRKRLLYDDTFKDLAALETYARSVLIKNSYPFLMKELKFIPYSTLPDVIEKLNKIQEAFDKFVEVFLIGYDLEKEKFLQEYEDLRERLQDKYPTPKELASKFYFRWNMFEISIPDGVRDKLIDQEHAEYLQNKWDSSREMLNQQMEYWIGDVGSRIRKEIVSTCENMLKILDSGHTMRTDSLASAKENIQRMKQMNFLDDPEVSFALDELENKLLTENDRDIPAVVNAFQRTLEQVKTNMINPSANLKRKFIL